MRLAVQLAVYLLAMMLSYPEGREWLTETAKPLLTHLWQPLTAIWTGDW